MRVEAYPSVNIDFFNCNTVRDAIGIRDKVEGTYFVTSIEFSGWSFGMPVAYVHLSDIHFGQERGGDRITNDDVKKELIGDAARQVAEHFGKPATGIIVTGDVAYGGKEKEYTEAGLWLDQLAAAVGCSPTAVQLVPGNHDIDRNEISGACTLMLEKIIADGEPQLDKFLKSEQDMALLYAKFAAYGPFAEAYDCPLDRAGGHASDRRVELAPGRFLRFIGLNSALICSANDVEGKLLLGAAQRVLPRTPGEELVVLCHHPLNWLRDSEDILPYVRSRARVLVTGHEHQPSLKIEQTEIGRDLMTLTAGATVSNCSYTT
jgi:predicted phosphodiesterase